MNAKCQFPSESKLGTGRQPFQRAARFVAAAKLGKFPAARNRITKPLSVYLSMFTLMWWWKQPVPPLACRTTCLFHSPQKTIQGMKQQHQSTNKKPQQSMGKWLSETLRSTQGLFQQRNTCWVWWHVKKLAKDQAGACLLYFLLRAAGSKHLSGGRNTYPEGSNKLGLQRRDCYRTSPRQRTATKHSSIISLSANE